jgi:hypothetical protein
MVLCALADIAAPSGMELRRRPLRRIPGCPAAWLESASTSSDNEVSEVNPFSDLPQVVVTPHTAGITRSSMPRALWLAAVYYGRKRTALSG